MAVFNSALPMGLAVKVALRATSPDRLDLPLHCSVDRQVAHMIQCFEDAVGRANVTLEGKRFDASLNYAVHTEYEAMNVPDNALLKPAN